ncbi:SepM family pheromone-processing serine protease [Saccharibacillus sp. CPCC 101409]|uniref:SepM family pheromone-processing serine protease n=1 Tax=Saccharibacillus sp. CPCC 101409 TaxID=3058041 RepID=UPI002671B76F|nr:SepM family pheromone-processing serine protease [Saccharibacillus sp. CPCC 101409]MDO3410744.1 SepM family pheromone-processing serine protease [Saccharibacillus sp. CPCC 101409]
MLRPKMPRGRTLAYLLCLALLVYVVVYMPTSYTIERPGSADEVKPMVSVAGGDPEENGTFMMTTVSVAYANLALMGLSLLDSDADIGKRDRDQDDDEYRITQQYYMNSSQSSAVAAAYTEAGIDFSVETEYAFITTVPNKDPQQKEFIAGDKILGVDDKAVSTLDDLRDILEPRKAGDTVEVELERGGKKIEQNVRLIEIDNGDGTQRTGFGVSTGEVLSVEPDNPDDEVVFTQTQVGGPSAGLMFTLEIYNQLTPGDLTRGYRIAGTGTIKADGTVGEIGGVQHKVVAAREKGAELFFVPRANYEVAKHKLEEMDSSMTLVPVDKLEDALAYIDKLPAKVQNTATGGE